MIEQSQTCITRGKPGGGDGSIEKGHLTQREKARQPGQAFGSVTGSGS